MNILLLGGTGFIGRNLKEGLVGHNIVTPTRLEMDVLNSTSVYNYFSKFAKFDLVLYCISIHENIFNNTLNAFHNIIRCKNFFNRMIYFGSWAELDRIYWHGGIKEDEFYSFPSSDEYGLSKYIINKYINERLDNDIINLRLFGTIGKYDRIKKRFLVDIYRQIKEGNDIIIKENQTMDLIYVDDIVKITQRFIDEGFGEYKSYNVCTGTCVEYAKIVEQINLLYRNKLSILYNKCELIDRYGNNERLLNKLGGFEFTKIEDAIIKSHNWYRSINE